MRMGEFTYILEDRVMQSLEDCGTIVLEINGTYVNNYYLFVNKTKKYLVRKIKENEFEKIDYTCNHSIKPKDSRQSGFLHGLDDNSIQLALCLGSAGTGKTTLALSYALEQKMLHDKKIVLSKAAVPIGRGKAFGPVPGDIKEKYAPYLSSYEIVLKKILGPKSKGYIRAMFEKQDIKYEPIEFVRGNTYEDCIFILDECQNLDWHELKTVISRIGQGSKIILLGDVYQSDVYFKHPQESGVQKLLYSNQFQNSPYTFNIELTKQYRGPLADLIYKIDNERKDT